jgi:hypothetical protein
VSDVVPVPRGRTAEAKVAVFNGAHVGVTKPVPNSGPLCRLDAAYKFEVTGTPASLKPAGVEIGQVMQCEFVCPGAGQSRSGGLHEKSGQG